MSIGHYVHWISSCPLVFNGVHWIQWTWCPMDMMISNRHSVQWTRRALVSINVHWTSCPLVFNGVHHGSNGHDVQWTSCVHWIHWTSCPLDPMDTIEHQLQWTWCPTDINGHQCTPCLLNTMSIGYHHVHWCSMVSIGSNGNDVQWTLMDINAHHVHWTLCPLDIIMSIGVQWCPLDPMDMMSNDVHWTSCPLYPIDTIEHQWTWCPMDINGHQCTPCPLDTMSIGYHHVHWCSMVSIGSNGNDVHWTWCPLDPMDNNSKMMLTHRFRLVMLSIGSIWMDPMDIMMSIGYLHRMMYDVHWTVQWCPLDPMDKTHNS